MKDEERPRAVIFGGSGLIGSALAGALQDDYRVVIVSRRPKNQPEIPPEPEWLQWDYRDPAVIMPYLTGKYFLVNLVGVNLSAGIWTPRKKKDILSSRIYLPPLLAGILGKIKDLPILYLQASAIGYYPDHSGEIQTESDARGCTFLADVTCRWEQSADPVENLGIRTVLPRFGMVLSPDGGALPKISIPFRLFAGAYFGTGREWVSWVDIDDLVEGMKFLICRSDARGIFNLTSPAPVQSRDFYRTLARLLDRPLWFRLPGFLLRLALGKMAEETILSSRKVIPQRLINAGFQFRYPELSSSLNHLIGKRENRNLP